MALVLTVDERAWRERVGTVAGRLGDRLVPVVKGNGYGFGRPALAHIADDLGVAEVAVGTVAELLPHLRPVQHVLTPALDAHLDAVPPDAVLTVGSAAQLAAAHDHRGPVALKLRSSMRRYGATPGELPELLDGFALAGRVPHAFVLHLPLAGSDDDRIAEIEQWLPALPPSVAAPLSVSHLTVDRFDALCASHPERDWRLRVGTALWHGRKGELHLGADVIEVRPIAAGEPAGYRLTPAPAAGRLVLVGAGSAHGVAPLPDGRSPFHFARNRLALLESPHMHTSMCFVPDGEPCPGVGEVVDVQRPLTQSFADRTLWIR